MRNYVLQASGNSESQLDVMRQKIYAGVASAAVAAQGIVVTPAQLRKLLEHVATLENGYKVTYSLTYWLT